MVKEENYSIQAKNLMEMIIKDCENSLMNFQRDNFLISEIKKLRFNINNRIRKISDLSELKTDLKSNSFKVIVFNTDYMEIITEQLNGLSLDYKIDGQYMNYSGHCFKCLTPLRPDYTHNKNYCLDC